MLINLEPDKEVVSREIARGLKPRGRLVISAIILDGHLPEAIEEDIYAYGGCGSGAMERKAYFDKVETAGFSSIEVLEDLDCGKSIVKHADRLFVGSATKPTNVVGTVRSVTFRAVKPR